MKIKTALKAGKLAAQSATRGAGQRAAAVLNKAVRTLTSPKFWTWPF